MSETPPAVPFYFEPMRQSPIAILLIMVRVTRALIGQLWPVLLIVLLRRRPGGSNPDTVLLWATIGIGVFVLVRALLAYFRTRFYVQDDEFVFEKGGLTHSRLTIPLDKIQTITFQQTFLHRIFNVVSVEMDTIGGKGSEVSIRALERKKADELRHYLLAWKKENVLPESTAAEPVIVEKIPEKVLLRLDFGALLRVGITQNHLRSAGILIGLGFSFANDIQPVLGKSTYLYLTEELGLSFDVFWSVALWLTLFFLVISVFATVVLTILRYFGLRFVQTGEGFRIEAGLFNRREQAAYLPKIQYLRWHSNPLQRMLGLLHLQFYQAMAQQLSANQTIQVPGCYARHIDIVREAYFPQSGHLPWNWIAPHRVLFYQRVFWIGIIPLLGLTIKTALDFNVYWLALCLVWLPVTLWWQRQLFRRRRYGLSTEGVWIQSGFFTAVQTLLLWRNVQAVAVVQSLLEARYEAIDLVLHTASGPVKIASVPKEAGTELRDYVLAKIEGLEEYTAQTGKESDDFQYEG